MYNKYGEENDLYGNDKYSWIIFDVFRYGKSEMSKVENKRKRFIYSGDVWWKFRYMVRNVCVSS